MPPIPEYRRPGAELSRSEFDAAIKKLKLSKATGPDGIPGEVFKACPQITNELYEIINYIWRHESVPANLVSGRFVMLWKRKGSSNERSL